MRYSIAVDQSDPSHPKLIVDDESELDYIAASHELLRFHVLAISDHQRSAEQLLNDISDEIHRKRSKRRGSADTGSDAERGTTL